MFWSEGWEYHGEYFDFPLRNVVPKPRQKPHPPLWVACSQLETIVMAGERGLGALGFQFVSAEAATAWVQRLLQRLHEAARQLCDLRDQPEHRRREPVHVRRDRRGGAGRWPTAARSSSSRCVFYNTHGPVVPGTVSLWDEYQAWKADAEGPGRAARRPDRQSPDTIREKLRALRGVERRPGDPAQPGRPEPPRAHLLESLELFAERRDARVPRPRARAPGVEGRPCSPASVAARRDRHRAVPPRHQPDADRRS